MGVTNNPKGRPPKSRALTELLLEAGDQEFTVNGQTLKGKDALSHLMWQYAITGEVTLGNRKLQVDSANDWFVAAKWIYEHVDGRAPMIGAEAGDVVISVRYAEGSSNGS